MAAVFITLQDKPDGTVDVQLVAEPTPQEGEFMTPAQRMGAAALNTIHSNLHSGTGIILADSMGEVIG